MKKQLVTVFLIICSCFILAQSRTNTITCEDLFVLKGTANSQGCCYALEEELEIDTTLLEDDYTCDGESTFVALPTNWVGKSVEAIQTTLEEELGEEWLLLFTNENFRCVWFPGCEIAEVALQETGIYTLRCRTCHSGYRKTTLGLCEECTVDDCIDCDADPDICEVCDEGYFIGTGGANCADLNWCLSATQADAALDKCTTCEDGYYKDANGECQPCATGYVRCTDIDSALECANDEEYFINTAGACVYIENCAQASLAQADLTDCGQCVSNLYYKDNDNVCQPCATGYLTCSAVNVGTCDTQNDYFQNEAGGCTLLDNCLTANAASASAGECQVCEEGYFLNTNKDCVWIEGCLVANEAHADTLECQQCDEDLYYFLQTDKDCVLIEGCLTSNQQNADSVICEQCDNDNNYFVESTDECVYLDYCIDASVQQADAAECGTCDTGYHLHMFDCTDECIQGALTCDDHITALTCDTQANYFIDSNSICVHIEGCSASQPSSAVNDNCDTCNNASHYFLQTDGDCVEIDYCVTSDLASADNSECDTCEEGYWNDAGTCKYCDTEDYWFWQDNDTCFESVRCESVTDASRALGQCAVCEDGYYLDNGDCVECPANVEKCSNANTPIQCSIDYNLIDGVCRLIEGCCTAAYNANTQTTTCSACWSVPGWLLSSGQCVDIDDDDCAEGTAGTVNTDYTCTRCNVGYKLDANSDCVQCAAINTLALQADCEACGYSWIQDQCVIDTISSCLIADATTGDCILCNYGTNWDSTSGACLPCDADIADWWDTVFQTEQTPFVQLGSCTITAWTAPTPVEPSDGSDSDDSGDNAFSMIFNMIALVILSLIAFFIV